jgi:hypothetical protein
MDSIDGLIFPSAFARMKEVNVSLCGGMTPVVATRPPHSPSCEAELLRF